MAKIIKVGSQTVTPNKIANPFQTSRTSTTNPFKYNNFEGNTLQFADVFEGFKPSFKAAPVNKMRMIASSVAGSMNKIKSSIPESVINFVNRIRTSAANAWQYAKNTNISDLPGVKAFNEVMNTPIEINVKMPNLKGLASSMAESMSTLKEGLASRMGYLNKDVLEVGNDIRTQWDALVARIPARTHYTANTPVAELEAAWLEINALEGGIA